LSALGPPWSQLTAYDLNTGEIMWQIPNGDVDWIDADEETGSPAPRGGPVPTGSGLLFVGTSSDRKVRAYDSDSGRELWSYDLPAASEGVPTTYEVNGRQYVVVPVGGTGSFSPQNQAPAGPGQYIAFALPAN
jgi:quinoprotein glucose dehydrogenase